jgi:predicted RNA-binding protein YlxR (DUF448 family)
VGCRRRAPRSDLVRIVIDSERHLALDRAGGAPGRGAYVCSDSKKKCFELAAARGRLGRALRAQVGAVDLEAIAKVLHAEAETVAEVLVAEASYEKRELIG